MSKVVENIGKIRLIGSKYHIEPTPMSSIGSGIVLPFKLEKEEEVDKLVNEISALEKFLKYYKLKTSFTDNGLEIDVRDKKYVEKNYGKISIEPVGTFGTAIYLSKPPREMEKTLLDLILQKTILGEKLKEYWAKEDSISLKKAKERLDEICSLPSSRIERANE